MTMQRVEHVSIGLIKPNTYNPNYMTPLQREILKMSLLLKGWITSILVTPEYEIINGEQRYTAAKSVVDLDWVLECKKEYLRVCDGSLPKDTRVRLDKAEKLLNDQPEILLCELDDSLIPVRIQKMSLPTQKLTTHRTNVTGNYDEAVVTSVLTALPIDVELEGELLNMTGIIKKVQDSQEKESIVDSVIQHKVKYKLDGKTITVNEEEQRVIDAVLVETGEEEFTTDLLKRLIDNYAVQKEKN